MAAAATAATTTAATAARSCAKVFWNIRTTPCVAKAPLHFFGSERRSQKSWYIGTTLTTV